MTEMYITTPIAPNHAESVTERGFGQYASIVDSYGATVRVQQSSAASDDYVWIFVGGGAIDDNEGSSHLNLEQAKAIRDALTAWITDVEEQPIDVGVHVQ